MLQPGWTAWCGLEVPLQSQSRSCWDRHIDSPTLEVAWITRRSSPLILFLKHAHFTPPGRYHAFRYYSSGLVWPGELYESKRDGDSDMLTLYPLYNLNL